MNADHISFRLAAQAHQVCSDFLQLIHANCFSYSRVFADGSRAELWTDARALRHTFIEKKYIVGAYTPIYYDPDERFAVLENKIESFPPNLAIRYAAQIADQQRYFDHAHPFLMVKKGHGYCEYFIFYSPRKQASALGFYINNLDLVEKFTEYFKIAAALLIRQAVETPLIQARDFRRSCPLRKTSPPINSNGRIEVPRHGKLRD